MIISSKELKKAFKDEWSYLRQIWLRNKKFIMVPTLEDLEMVVEAAREMIPPTPTIAGFNECENKALYLLSAVRLFGVQHCASRPKEEHLNLAFGEFISRKDVLFFGTLIHTACICYCDYKFYVIEPMEDYSIKEISKYYKPFFINM